MQRKGGTSDIRGNDIREIERKKNGGEGMQGEEEGRVAEGVVDSVPTCD